MRVDHKHIRMREQKEPQTGANMMRSPLPMMRRSSLDMATGFVMSWRASPRTVSLAKASQPLTAAAVEAGVRSPEQMSMKSGRPKQR